MKRRDFLLGWAGLVLGCRRREAAANEAGSIIMRPASALVPADEHVAAAPILGINSHQLREEDLRLVRDLGITHLRNTLQTQLWTDRPTYRVAVAENTARVTSNGMQLLYLVHNTYGKVFWMRNDRAAARGIRDVMSDMVRRLPAVEAWQLWNEQDTWVQAPFGAGENPPQSPERVGANYAVWWRDAYSALKAINPKARFVTGGTADPFARRGRAFLRGMMESGIEADAIAVHAYGNWRKVRPVLVEAREIIAGRAPLWVTECGASGGPQWTPQLQLDAWRSVIEGNERERLAARLYPYDLETDPNDPWSGLRDVDGSPRPVLQWLRSRKKK